MPFCISGHLWGGGHHCSQLTHCVRTCAPRQFGAGPNFGGGAIIGVSSLSEKQGLRVFNNKTHYNEWYFIYDPSLDRGGLLEGPYRTKQFGGTTSNVGVPIAPGASGQQPGGFGMQPQSNPQPQMPQSPR